MTRGEMHNWRHHNVELKCTFSMLCSFFPLSIAFFFQIEEELIYDIVLVSGVQQ